MLSQQLEQTEEPVREVYEIFTKQMQDAIPNILQDNHDDTVIMHDGHCQSILALSRQMMIDDILTNVEKNLDMKVLYSICYNRRRYYEAVAYTTHSNGQLAVIALQSCQYGLVSNLTIDVYTDYQPVYDMLTRSLLKVIERAKKKKGNTAGKKKPAKILQRFFLIKNTDT